MRTPATLLSLATLALIAACGGETSPPTAESPRAIQSVAISPAGSLQLGVGDSIRFNAVAQTATGAPSPSVRWRVSDPSLATISADGMYTAIGQGSVTVIAVASTAASGAFRADSMVSSALVSSIPRAITAIEAQPGMLSTAAGSIVQFESQVIKSSPSVQVTMSYQLQQPGIGTVDQNGVITTWYAGQSSFRITATGSAPGYATTTLSIDRLLNVIPTPGITTFEVPATITVAVGSTVRLPITLVQPRAALNAGISANSTQPAIATAAGEFTDWSVTGVKSGTTTITFLATFPGSGGYYANSKQSTVTVNVVAP